MCSISQRYNSKAIHNNNENHNRHTGVVLNLSKIQFKSNSQLVWVVTVSRLGCAQSLKDTIQKQFTTHVTFAIDGVTLCSISQRYNSKAIHNQCFTLSSGRCVVLNLSKIQFKSNSQQFARRRAEETGCAQSLKDTIQKQFTTRSRSCSLRSLLCSISQRYNSKAIHNARLKILLIEVVVLNLSKIQFKSNSQAGLKSRGISVPGSWQSYGPIVFCNVTQPIISLPARIKKEPAGINGAGGPSDF